MRYDTGTARALVVAVVLLAVGCGGGDKVAYKELLDEDPFIRADAAMRLGESGSTAAVESLAAIVDDPDEVVRVQTIRALGQIGDPSAIPAVISRADDELNTVRMAVCQALGMIADPAAIETLKGLLQDRNDTVRIGAAKALDKIKDPAALEVLVNVALRDESETVRQHVMKVIMAEGAKKYVPEVEAAMMGEADIVRANAAWALGEVGDASSVPTLILGLDDPYHKVRSMSAHSMVAIAPDALEVRDALRARLNLEEEGMVQVDLAWNLAKAGDRSGMEVIRDLLFTGQPEDVRAEAAMALGEVGDESDIGLLEKAMNDKKGLVKRQAYLSILKLKEA